MVVRSGTGSRLVLVAVLLVLAGCAGNASTSPLATASAPASPSKSPTASALATPRASDTPRAPTPTPPDPAPAELIGSWEMMLGTEQVTLTLAEHGYRIKRGLDNGSGRLAVRGDEIDFSKSTVCDLTGMYRWSLTGEALKFSPIGVDPCPGRRKLLEDKTYTRAAP
jgi:hypothetical protein